MRPLRQLLVAAMLAGPPAYAQEPALDRAPISPLAVSETELAEPTDFASYNEAADPAAADAASLGPEEAKKQAAEAKKKKESLQKAIATAYAPVFYNNNFKYLSNPLYHDSHLGEALKQMPVSSCWTLDVGGQYRLRHHSERGLRGSGITGVNDDFLLQRTRLYSNLAYGDDFRVYAEMIDAVSSYERFAPRIIEENRADMLNLFADVKVLDTGCGNLKLRAGRQELLYGSERLISPLDWANTRRTFEGYKLMWQGEDWNIDTFYTRPVTVRPKVFDSADYDQEFSGMFATYKAVTNQTFDAYYLNYFNGRAPQRFQYQTIGGRWSGTEGPNLWELEGGVQFGNNTAGSGHGAGFVTAGRGYKWDDLCWKPTLWAFYDWASGGPNLGQRQGFDHLFPLGHKYLGFMDLFARSNIQSPNLQLTWQPHKKVKMLAWYYYLFLSDPRDTPYNLNMTPFNPVNKPGSAELGHELDLLTTINLNARQDIVLGYSHFFTGAYYRTTPGVPSQNDANFFYTQYQVNF
ncbi:MAG: alginate export family protein [Planctomycetaceae bacterium]|nr:alginate export family protein [Planctomycetaceae bacterium]